MPRDQEPAAAVTHEPAEPFEGLTPLEARLVHEKLQVHSKSEAVTKALRSRLISERQVHQRLAWKADLRDSFNPGP